MNNIISYINLNPIPFIIMIVIMLFIIYKIYGMQICCDNIEKFDKDDKVDNPILQQTPSQLVSPPAILPIIMTPLLNMNHLNDQLISSIETKKLVRFKYISPDNKTYYLSTMPLSTCAKEQINKNKHECISNILVLMNEDIVNTNVINYLAEIKKHIKLCNYNKSLITNPNAVSAEIYPECDINPQYQTDFVVTKMMTNTDIKYNIQGVILGSTNMATPAKYYMNKQKGINNLCADTFSISLNDPYIGIDLITVQVCDKFGNKKLNTKIRFNIIENDIYGNKDNIVNNIVYLGICPDIKCNNYMRLCLYSDELNKNVITFEPIIHNYQINII